MTPVAARLTALRLGRESFRPLDLRAEEARFVFLPLLRAALLRPPPFRAALLRPTLLRAGRFLPFDFRAGDFRLLERPAFLPPFEPRREDFLAAAMIRAPIWGFSAQL